MLCAALNVEIILLDDCRRVSLYSPLSGAPAARIASLVTAHVGGTTTRLGSDVSVAGTDERSTSMGTLIVHASGSRTVVVVFVAVIGRWPTMSSPTDRRNLRLRAFQARRPRCPERAQDGKV